METFRVWWVRSKNLGSMRMSWCHGVMDALGLRSYWPEPTLSGEINITSMPLSELPNVSGTWVYQRKDLDCVTASLVTAMSSSCCTGWRETSSISTELSSLPTSCSLIHSWPEPVSLTIQSVCLKAGLELLSSAQIFSSRIKLHFHLMKSSCEQQNSKWSPLKIL